MKRLRPVNSCLPCRKRRVRCDKVHPSCERCRISQVECVYDQSAAGNAQEQESLATPSTKAFSTATATPSSYVSEGLPVVSQELGSQTSAERGQFQSERGGRSSYLGSTFWANPIQSEYQSFCRDTPGISRRRFDSPSRWLPPGCHIVDWVHQEIRGAPPSEIRMTSAHPSQCKACGDSYKLSCIVAMLPNKVTCEKLCDLFFATVFPLMPLLHLPTFAADFTSFWKEVDPVARRHSETGPFLRAKPGFVCLLSSILFATLASASPLRLIRILGEHSNLTSGDMYFAVVISGTLTGFPQNPSIYTLSAYIFTQSQLIREEEYGSSQELIMTAFRVALGMGLHRQLPAVRFSTAELETRSRLWCYIVHLDVMASASSGLSPLFINENMANIEMMSSYYLDEGSSEQEQQQDVRYLVAVQRYELSKQIRAILKLHFEDSLQSANQFSERDGHLKSFWERANTISRKLLPKANSPVYGSATPAPDDTGDPSTHSFARLWKIDPNGPDRDVSAFCAWSSILVHMMVHKAYCILYHPIFRDPVLADNESLRSNAIEHAQAFVQLFTRLCEDPLSEAFNWIYPGIYQPLQPLAALLADLLEYPHGIRAEQSRGLVDAVFKLYQVDEGVLNPNNSSRRQLSPLGSTAWSILGRTRKKALKKIGQDPHTMFPSHKASSDHCICGERISWRYSGTGDTQSAVDYPTQSLATPMNIFDVPGSQGLTPSAMFVAESTGSGFNWEEWDASLPTSSNVLP